MNGTACRQVPTPVRRSLWLGLLLAILANWMSAALAVTTVSGAIVADATWTAANSPYLVTADLSVSQGAVLTIEPGVLVQMNPGISLTVSDGSLRAQGSAAQPIVITSAKDVQNGGPAPGDWGQLVFLDLTNDAGTRLDWVEIRYGSGLRIERASPTLNHLNLQNHNGPAIALDLESSPVGTGLQASGNTLNGISVPAGEIANSTTWALRGIPYVIASGTVSVGIAPRLDAISPAEIQQGRSIDATLTGSRLDGLDRVTTDSSLVVASVISAAAPDHALVRITADRTAPLGPLGLQASTMAGGVRTGNLLTVVPYLSDLTVSGITPGTLRRGETKAFSITGSNLAGASVAGRIPQLSATVVSSSDNLVQVSVNAAADTPLGPQVLAVSNPGKATGVAEVTVTVAKALPAIVVNPTPIAVYADDTAHDIKIGLSDFADQSYVLDLLVGNTAYATISTAQVTIPTGSKEVLVGLTGKAYGQTNLKVSSSLLPTATVPISVLIDFGTIRASYLANPVGVVVDPMFGYAPHSLAAPPVGVSADGSMGQAALSFAAPPVAVTVDGSAGQQSLSLAAPAVGVVLETGVQTSALPAFAWPVGVDLATQ